MEPTRIAIVGAGISGLVCAWLLSRTHKVTLFEAAHYLGGHTNTVDVTLEGKTYPVDTGFLVFNKTTYPNLIALFSALGVQSTETEMSFAVSLQHPNLEWAGSNLSTVFGQKRNLLRPAFWRMLSDIVRFNKESIRWLAHTPNNPLSLRNFLQAGHYSRAFSDWYLLPMGAAIWSCPTGQMLDMPAASFIRFCNNHGLLQVTNRPKWRTIQGGGRSYVQKIAAELPDIRLNCPVQNVTRTADGLNVQHAHGSEQFDHVVMACHSDQTLSILGDTASAAQQAILSAIPYQANRAILHTDTRLLPRKRKLWSAWNYFADDCTPGTQAVGVSYLINTLQHLPFQTPVIVTLNPAREPDRDTVLAEFDYAHPVFDGPAIAAQEKLPEVQGQNMIWLAGAWGSYGFHEDGVKSALSVVNSMGIYAPWQATEHTQSLERKMA